ncbi:hypothetical protein ACHAQF_007107 [Verticillium nonalfalfae]
MRGGIAHSFFALLAGLSGLPHVHAVYEDAVGQYPDNCPQRCSEVGPDPSNWTRVRHLEALSYCDEPLLFDINVQNDLSGENAAIPVRACSQAESVTKPTIEARQDGSVLSTSNNCGANVEKTILEAEASGSSDILSARDLSADHLDAAIGQLESYLNRAATCGTTIFFAKAGNIIAGLYSGANIQHESALDFLQTFRGRVFKGDRMLQLCKTNKSAQKALGIAVGTLGDLAEIQSAVKAWTNGECVQTGSGPSSGLVEVELGVLVSTAAATVSPPVAGTLSSYKRALCRDIQVAQGDGCASMASRCGISLTNFEKFNPKTCDKILMPKQYVCCTAGDLPDHTPQPGADGSCRPYKVGSGDGCWAIADAFGITQQQIENFNKKTWGWAGCGALQAEQIICLSTGSPPFPASIPDTQCGPQVPGTTKPTDGTPWNELNQCPLKSCCSVWGYCGTTAEFCTKGTGPAGTRTAGCMSNCGMGIIGNDKAPEKFRKVGYFEGWNQNRKCLRMHARQIDLSTVTHVHFAFVNIKPDFSISIDENMKEQWQQFRELGSSVKKIPSFGGWAFSTEPDTVWRFRDATKPANRLKFATNVVAFMNDEGLDGLDFDWEYPGATDIPDVPPGTKEEANNYLEFLKLVKRRMSNTGKELSVAIPASFWYLKPYPVEEMAKVLDYFVYMTYDFHGVPASKVLVGVSSYGRSFRMVSPGCSGFMCTYLGTRDSSQAYKGPCTETAGYISNAEIEQIKTDNPENYPVRRRLFDTASDSDILIYGTREKADFVGYMTKETKMRREKWAKELNFGGTIDWAVDLMEFMDENDSGGDDHGGGGNTDPDDVCRKEDRTFSDERPDRDGEYMRWFLMEPEHATTTTRTYITIVNLTPHTFTLTTTHSYQMDEFNWKSIPPGKSRQNVAVYTSRVGANPKDTNGEAYYSIGNTGKQFVVRVTTHIPDTYPRRIVFDLSGMGQGQREYKVPEQEVPVTLVITGSYDYGFITSLSHGAGAWMKGIKKSIWDRPLRHVVMPATHDAGMSRISGAILTGASSENTQTQGLTTYDQLQMGSRWFDLRVQTVHAVTPSCCDDYEFWTTHINDERADAPIGRSGEKFDEVVDNINRFTAEHPGEVIILQFRYLIGIRNTPSLGPIYWQAKQKNEFFDKLKSINNRCPNIPVDPGNINSFEQRTMGSFMESNNKNGCVLIFLDTAHLLRNIPEAQSVSRGDGIYHKDDFAWTNSWSEKEDTREVAEYAVEGWKRSRSKFIVSQWLSTLGPLVSTLVYSIQAVAVLPNNPALYWRGVPEITPTQFPNAIMVDYIGQLLMNEQRWDQLGGELKTLAIGLNLYTLSENCDINKRRSVLLPTKSSNGRFAAAPAQDNPLVSSWNGIIFANGTVINNPPPTLHVGQPEILRNGTRFSNGTVLTKDIRNPEFQGPFHANLTGLGV